MKLNYFCAAAVTCVSTFLVGCGEEKVRTVSYYTENPDEIEKVSKKCKAEIDKGYQVEGNLAENCKNARIAANDLMREAILTK